MGGGGVSAGCAFGGHFYALEETWHPDLGEPFGVMRCVICHCEPVSAPTHPFPWETPPGPGSAGEGAGKEGVPPFSSIRSSHSHGRGKRDPFSQPDTWMFSPAAGGRRRGV